MPNKPCTVRIKKGGSSVEILCKPGSIEKFREGRLGFDNCVMSDDLIFSNAQKMTKAKESDVKKLCNGLTGRDAVEFIAREGEFSLTSTEIKEKVSTKRREIINYLVKYYYDASKKPPIPHPISRLESILEEMKYTIDFQRNTEDQIKEIVKKLPNFLPVVPQNPPHIEREAQAKEQNKLDRIAKSNDKATRDDRGRERYRGKGKRR